MSATMMDEGKIDLLFNLGVSATPVFPDLLIALFTNNHAPMEDDDSTDYVEGASSIGYASQGLGAGSWNQTLSTDTVTYSSNNFSFGNDSYTGAPLLAYGYFVWDEGRDIMYFAERFDSPYTFPLIGGTLFLQLNLGCNQLPLP